MAFLSTDTDVAICFHSFVAFHKVRIPRENLLNKTGDVTPDGRYVTPYKVSTQFM